MRRLKVQKQPLTELLTEKEIERRKIAKHNRLLRRIKKEFKRMPYVDITPHESLAQVTIARASRDRNRLERRKLKLCQKKKK